jgi:hypothetical protein
MKNTIKCKNCGAEIEVSEALKHQIEEQVVASLETKHKADIEEVRKKVEKEASKKAGKELEEEKERNKKLSGQLEELLEEVRKLRRKDEERDIEMKKKLLDEEEKIRKVARKKADEEHELKDREKEKMIHDLKKSLNIMRRKAEQGSQQTQGEVLELELEEILKKEFPADAIEEIKKGQRGADVLQRVIDKKGRNCGTILWESKNAQWSNGWISKLKEDQRQAKSHLACLVVSNPPDDIETFNYMNGVWVTTRKMVVPLALALRFDLVRVNFKEMANVGKNEKMEVLFQYITSTEFKHRIEAIGEAFGNLQGEIEREKRWCHTKWARQEKELRKVVDHTYGMYGDLQGFVGKSLPDIKTISLPEGDEEKSN